MRHTARYGPGVLAGNHAEEDATPRYGLQSLVAAAQAQGLKSTQ
jgi:hypothetical protein